MACQEWNDLAPEATTQSGTYQTLPETTARFWNLIKFSEHDSERGFHWLMRKDQCMHCAEPGCLIACPAPGAIVQYANGIVDFQQDQCIGCGYCITGCPFNVPKFATDTRRVYKCTLCVDRVAEGLQPACVKACPTSCLQFGTKDAMLEVAEQRVARLKEDGLTDAAVYDPPGVGGTGVVTVLAFGEPSRTVRAAARSHRAGGGARLEGRAEMDRQSGDAGRAGRRGAPLRALRPQARRRPRRRRRRGVSACAPGPLLVRRARRALGRGRVSYVYLLLTGLAFWTPGLYWIATCSAAVTCRGPLHPIVGVVFAAVVAWMYPDVAARHAHDRRRSGVAAGDGRLHPQ